MFGNFRKCIRATSTPAVVVALLITLSLIAAPSASAQHPAGFGNLMISSGSWLGGQGVDAYSNGTSAYVSDESYSDPKNTSYGANINTGMMWQCVELPQRLYTERGWHNSLFPVGCAYEIYDVAGSIGAKSYPNDGNGYVPVPGDMIVLDGGPWCNLAHTHHVGHVSVVDYIDSNNIYVVEQNWDNKTGKASYARSGNNGSVLTRTGSTYSVRGVVHNLSNHNTNGGGVDATNPYVDGGFSGTQIGTAANPFKTVAQAISAASATQATVHIKPGTYSEKVGTSKHIHFVTWGSGIVRIGG